MQSRATFKSQSQVEINWFSSNACSAYWLCKTFQFRRNWDVDWLGKWLLLHRSVRQSLLQNVKIDMPSGTKENWIWFSLEIEKYFRVKKQKNWVFHGRWKWKISWKSSFYEDVRLTTLVCSRSSRKTLRFIVDAWYTSSRRDAEMSNAKRFNCFVFFVVMCRFNFLLKCLGTSTMFSKKSMKS